MLLIELFASLATLRFKMLGLMRLASGILLSVIILYPLSIHSASQRDADRAVAYLVRAQRLQSEGNLDGAAQAYQQALNLRPSNPKAFLLASRFYEKVGRLTDAVGALKLGLEIIPSSFMLHTELGFIFATMKQFSNAATQFRLARRINPSAKDNLVNLASSLLKASAQAFEKKQWDLCLAEIQEAESIGQPLPGLNYMAGMAYFRKGQNDKAIDYFKRAVRENPNSWQAHYDLGLALSAETHWKEAYQRFLRVVELNSSYAPAFMFEGRALHQMNRSEESIPLFEKALSLNPRLPLAHYHLGFALKGLAKYSRARDELQKEISLNPNYAPAYFELGLIAIEEEGNPQALKYFRKVQSLRPNEGPAYYQSGKILLSMGRYLEAASAFKAFLKMEPSSLEGTFGLFRAFQRAGHSREAARALARYRRLRENRTKGL